MYTTTTTTMASTTTTVSATDDGNASATTAATATPDEVEVVLSGDPGATGATVVLKFIGVAGSSDAS